MSLKPIETAYAGHRFRSRLEARWAVFFDAADIPWDYEPEGFNLPSGPYLPDFWLPAIQTWVEIKPSLPSEHEIRLCIELFSASIKRVVILAGSLREYSYGAPCLVWGDPRGVVIQSSAWLGGDRWEAFAAALGARFEHGESGPEHISRIVRPVMERLANRNPDR